MTILAIGGTGQVGALAQPGAAERLAAKLGHAPRSQRAFAADGAAERTGARA